MKTLKSIGLWIWSYLWGLPLTLLGTIITLVLLCTGHKPHRFHHNIYFMVGSSNWGGLELGPFFLTDTAPNLSIKQHEAGHGLQNLIFGPLMPFLITIPSAFRYWFREMHGRENKITYIATTSFLFLIPGLIFYICGLAFNLMWLWIIGIAWGAYFISVCLIWPLYELPKYDCFPQPDYDEFWCEGWATRLGEKYFSEDK